MITISEKDLRNLGGPEVENASGRPANTALAASARLASNLASPELPFDSPSVTFSQLYQDSDIVQINQMKPEPSKVKLKYE